jgi:predicted ABC-type ATPase
VFLAGPNGAGKSTFFDEYLAPLGLPFVNADRVAAALRAADSRASADETDRRAFATAEALRDAFVESRLSFCTESVFSDPVGSKLAFLERARERGYSVLLIFIGLERVDLSVARVMQRVGHGGHDVADAKLHARFPRVLDNVRAAALAVEEAFLFDNSSYDTPFRLVLEYARGKVVRMHPPLPAWTRRLPGVRSPATHRAASRRRM